MVEKGKTTPSKYEELRELLYQLVADMDNEIDAQMQGQIGNVTTERWAYHLGFEAGLRWVRNRMWGLGVVDKLCEEDGEE